MSATFVTCCVCGIEFSMPKVLNEKLRANHAYFWCPSGHQQHYTGQSEAERLKAALEVTERVLASTRRDRDRAENSRRAHKAWTTRLRNKVKSGKCPECGERVDELARHMTERHEEERR